MRLAPAVGRRVITIWPLGDSITAGAEIGGDPRAPLPSYRYWLWKMLRERGYADAHAPGACLGPASHPLGPESSW
jgi:hypothetical protein